MTRACPHCGADHGVEQRYCVECGRRLRAVPARVRATLLGLADPRAPALSARSASARRGTAPPRGRRPSSDQPDADQRAPLTLFGQALEAPSPRAIAATVLAVVAFGVIIGTTSLSSAAAPLTLTLNRPAATAIEPTPLALAPSSDAGTSDGSGAAASSGSAAPGSSASGGSGSGAGAGSGSSGGATGSGTSGGTRSGTASEAANQLPPIEHVWVIELGDQGYAQTFEKGSPDTYLSTTLARQGEVVPFLYASATSDLANEIGLVSGQGPTVQTEADCPRYTAIRPGAKAESSSAQVKGDGCVYPKSTPSLPSELTKAGYTWRAYVQGLGTAARAGCTHPALNAVDRHYAATGLNGYQTWRNPIVYLAGLTAAHSCGTQDTGIGALAGDLHRASSTPNVSFILPNACDDGSDTPCRRGAPAGTAQSDHFLRQIVPRIESSPAYKKDGMILITFAQAPQSGAGADHSSCCDQPARFPNLPGSGYEPTTFPGVSTASTSTTATGTPPTTTTGTTTGVASPPATGTATTPTGVTSTTATGTATTGTGTTPASTCPSTTTSGTNPTSTATGTGTTPGSPATTSPTATPTTPGSTTSQTTTTGTGTTTTTTTGCASAGAGQSSATGGGGQVGMLVLSRYVSKNLQDGSDYFNTFSITASIEQLFGLKDTGYAAIHGLPLFSGFFYSNATG